MIRHFFASFYIFFGSRYNFYLGVWRNWGPLPCQRSRWRPCCLIRLREECFELMDARGRGPLDAGASTGPRSGPSWFWKSWSKIILVLLYILVRLFMLGSHIHRQLLRLSAARGLNTRFFLVCPAKVNACKSFLFTQKFPILVENKEHPV